MNLDRMKKLAGIKLTESVMAVPAIGEGSEAAMQTAGTIGRNQSYANFDASQPMATEEDTAWSAYNNEGVYEDDDADSAQFIQRFTELTDSFVDPTEAIDVVMREMDEAGLEADKMDAIYEQLVAILNGDNEEDHVDHGSIDSDDPVDDLADTQSNGGLDAGDLVDDSMFPDEDDETFEESVPAVKSCRQSNPANADVACEMEEAFDMNNGYDDINYADGQDFFPDGADGPVVDAVGPSGARHGDNPEQKRMQVSEVHKELVYGYRNYLKETK